MDNPFSPMEDFQSRCKGALLAASIGDSLGWITEFIRSPEELRQKFGVEEITEHQSWNKLVGGRFQGYQDNISVGEYSDDTQLTICTAVCIKSNGTFDEYQFSKVEYPSWLEYARGAGGTVKEAAKKIQRKSATWNNNFFTRKIKNRVIDYRDGGANGAAMRISPHVLANYDRWEQAEVDIWKNCIISHGHPRAIIGALLYGYALHLTLGWSDSNTGLALIESLGNWIKTIAIPKTQDFKRWMAEWNKNQSSSFDEIFTFTKKEAIEQLRLIWSAIKQNKIPKQVLEELGCFRYETKGSGLATALAGIYIFSRQPHETKANIICAVNMIGTDTDSIAAFVGGLGGAAFGEESIPEVWLSQVQDAQFLRILGQYLASVSLNQPNLQHPRLLNKKAKRGKAISRHEISLKVPVIHKCLGSGYIENIEEQSLLSKNKTISILTIRFDCGQFCKFPLRSEQYSESLFFLER